MVAKVSGVGIRVTRLVVSKIIRVRLAESSDPIRSEFAEQPFRAGISVELEALTTHSQCRDESRDH
jgi:hypothetical protein